MPSSIYYSSVLLSSSISILCTRNPSQDLINYSRLYGHGFITLNVHSLIHLPDWCEQFGELDCFSCFPFESYLGRLKRLLRSGSRPLDQVTQRLQEQSTYLSTNFCLSNKLILTKQLHTKGPVIDPVNVSKQYSTCIYKGVQFSTSPRNRCFSCEGQIFFLINVLEDSDCNVLFVVQKFMSLTPFFD